jgi:transketolase
MAALANGLSLHGGSRPILGASVISIDRMRPALRLAAAMGRPVVYLLADESLDQSIEQAGWPPMEQLASLRAMPRTALFRPADPDELAACWELFAARPPAYHAKVLGDAPRIGIEAASGFGWERWLGRDGIFIGMDDFGPNLHSAVPPGIAAPLGPAGITAERISTRIARLLGARP